MRPVLAGICLIFVAAVSIAYGICTELTDHSWPEF